MKTYLIWKVVGGGSRSLNQKNRPRVVYKFPGPPLSFFLSLQFLSQETLGVAHFYTLERPNYLKGSESCYTTRSNSQNLRLKLWVLVLVVLIPDSSLSSKSKFNLTWSCLAQDSDGNRESNPTCGRTSEVLPLPVLLIPILQASSPTSQILQILLILLLSSKTKGRTRLDDSGAAWERFLL